jgi:hypothetical protein
MLTSDAMLVPFRQQLLQLLVLELFVALQVMRIVQDLYTLRLFEVQDMDALCHSCASAVRMHSWQLY